VAVGETQGWSYEEAIRFLEAAINYEKITRWKYDDLAFSLERVERLLRTVGSPHEYLKCVHVAGTKGKGSTAALLASILKSAGYRTGLFTSPHLMSVNERIIVDGLPMSRAALAERLLELKNVVGWQRLTDVYNSPSYFELLTALCFRHFQLCPVDYSVIEVGLGGRLDSTNVISAIVSVITTIGWDHMDKLGWSIKSIALEKAGIIKPGGTVVIGAQRYRKALMALLHRAEELAERVMVYGRDFRVSWAEISTAGERPGWRFGLEIDHPWLGRLKLEPLSIGFMGKHQLLNAATSVASALALSAAQNLAITDEAIRAGLAGLRWPGRIDFIGGSPALIVDVAHTAESVAAVVEAVRTHLPGRRRWYVFGCSKDKDAAGMLRLLAEDAAGIVVTSYKMARSASAESLFKIAGTLCPRRVLCVPDVGDALDTAVSAASGEDLVCVTGSFFIAAEAYEFLRGKGTGDYPL